MLLRQIKSESYGVLRYKLFRPSLSAKIFKGSHNDSLFLYYQNKWNDRDKKSD